ncbi:MAG: hypothetical protein ABSA39_11470 [Edaphobacter sp.]
MHFDPGILRSVAFAVILLIVFGSRLTTGSSRQTADGLVFGIKPVIVWARVIILPVLIFFVIYALKFNRQAAPWWVFLLFFAAIVFIIVQMPGTITLTPTAITQRYWFQPSKTIQYNEVMAIQAAQAGRMTRVLGDNRVRIAHTQNHSAANEFRQELERRTGKRLIA